VTTIQDVECYIDTDNQWQSKEKMIHNRSALSGCVISGLDFVRPFSAIENKAKLIEKMNKQFLKRILLFEEFFT
jgi:hypothetical protein